MTVLVYQRRNMRDFNRFSSEPVGDQNLNDFDRVAEIETDDMEQAFRLTNSVDSYWANSQHGFPGYILPPPAAVGGWRSTSVGDLMYDGLHYFIVAACGFEPVAVRRQSLNERRAALLAFRAASDAKKAAQE